MQLSCARTGQQITLANRYARMLPRSPGTCSLPAIRCIKHTSTYLPTMISQLADFTFITALLIPTYTISSRLPRLFAVVPRVKPLLNCEVRSSSLPLPCQAPTTYELLLTPLAIWTITRKSDRLHSLLGLRSRQVPPALILVPNGDKIEFAMSLKALALWSCFAYDR